MRDATFGMRRTLFTLVFYIASASCADSNAPQPSNYDVLFVGETGVAGVSLLFISGVDRDVDVFRGGMTGLHVDATSDGAHLVLHRINPTTSAYELMIARDGATSAVPLTGVPDADNREAVWSPNGTRIAFVSHRDDFYGDIFVGTVNGTELTQVTNLTANAPGSPDTNPDWSADGQFIAFTSYRTGYPSVWVMRADGGEARQVTFGSNTFSDYFPSWSPDGATLAFQRIGTAASLVGTVPSAGGEPSFFELAGRNYSPAWSPDGSFIAIASDDGDVRILTTTGALVRRIERSGRDHSPTWIRGTGE
jgi:hypothetical protein